MESCLILIFLIKLINAGVQDWFGQFRCSGRLRTIHDQTDGQVLGAAAFDKGDTQMWTQEIQCRGNESQIHLCPLTTSHENNCSHGNDVGLVCADSVNVRLVGGHSRCAGKVEVLHRGQWGTLCNENWDMADAAVVCRELDCGEPVDALGGDHFGPASGPIWMSTVMCTGSESTLKNCGSAGGFRYDCRESGNAAVICSGKLL
ncbi:hypothetical protein cypCar_00028660 [Cyprinus carpio]|nr:hypothetical protein cypCar_00028660 [Cyprinus carpio]